MSSTFILTVESSSSLSVIDSSVLSPSDVINVHPHCTISFPIGYWVFWIVSDWFHQRSSWLLNHHPLYQLLILLYYLRVMLSTFILTVPSASLSVIESSGLSPIGFIYVHPDCRIISFSISHWSFWTISESCYQHSSLLMIYQLLFQLLILLGYLWVMFSTCILTFEP